MRKQQRIICGVVGGVVFATLFSPALTRATTNAEWGSPERPVYFRPVDSSKVRIDSPGSAINSIVPCGSFWLVVSNFQVYAYSGTTLSNITPYVNPFGVVSQSRPTVACGANRLAYITYYQHTAGSFDNTVVLEYDGQTVSSVDVSSIDYYLSQGPVQLAAQTHNGKVVFVHQYGDALWLYDGVTFERLSVVQSEAQLADGDYTLALAFDKLYKIVGGTAVNISAQTQIKTIRDVQLLAGSWYIGGWPLADSDGNGWANSFLKYTGSSFVDLSASVKGWSVAGISDAPEGLIVQIGGQLFRWQNGSRTLIYGTNTDAINNFQSIGWNGSYWLAGTFLRETGGLYRFDTEDHSTETKVYTNTKMKFSFRYPVTWDAPQYFTSSKPNQVGTILPQYKKVSYWYNIQSARTMSYDTPSIKKALNTSWGAYVNAFVHRYKQLHIGSGKTGYTKLVSWSQRPFIIDGLIATRITFKERAYGGLGRVSTWTKKTYGDEFILIGTIDRKKVYVLNLNAIGGGWTNLPTPYTREFENLARSFRIL